jgi:two-component sensor histidine kinase
MALHELTTNASKYGALSAPEGRIEVGWRVDRPEGERPMLRIEWREHDGPPVDVPKRHGFGTRFIEGSIAAEMQGTARIDFDPAGLRCVMSIPLDAATPAAEAS